MTSIPVGDPVLLVFRQVLIGDILKYQTQSNHSATGGGARDLRFRHGNLLHPVLLRMFTTTTSNPRITTGQVYWRNVITGSSEKTTIELHQPTAARPNELRLAKIYNIKGWEISQTEFDAINSQGLKYFYFLVLDSNNRTWARLFSEQFLPGQIRIVRDYIRRRIQETPNNKAVCGSLDFTTFTEVP